ncbi:acyltransferase family protein [Terriglobus aquaticus]|uniref:Acyltransferase family protein n=1 Tax=Terriglobus aquaticus TaxID=940139 RepID=A0ABW9KHW9_9BACT|nr:acyltransferase [Terriglobus aquaticus]
MIEPSRQQAKRYYRPELDVLRFLAFLAVFAFHRMDYVPTDPVKDLWVYRVCTVGAFGVPVFFLLSAFLITELLLREEAETGQIHVRAFYVRRILRIWPLYFAVFFGLALLNRFVPGVGTDNPLAWLAFTFFSGNWYITFKGWIAGSVDPLWSISVEEQFYLLVPVLAAWGGRKALAVTSYGCLAGAYIAVFLYGLHRSPGDHGEWTNSFVHFQFFAAGTLIALVLRGRLITWSAPVRLLGMATGIACWFGAMLGFQVQSWEPQPTAGGSVAGWLLILLGTCLMFLSMLGMSEHHVPKALAYLGRISYGLYLFHSFVFFLVFEQAKSLLNRVAASLGMREMGRNAFGTIVVLVLSVVVAHLSYRYFESFFLKLKRRFTLVQARD